MTVLWAVLLVALQAHLFRDCSSRIVIEAPSQKELKIFEEHGYHHPCKRNCTEEKEEMLCYYSFDIENYYTMSKACYNCPNNNSDCFRPDCIVADGIPRQVIVANRKLPGPSIEVCQGDTIRVDVHNAMSAESTSVHWHGQHQRLHPYMDGVPHVTQCPIPPGNTFRYEFEAENPGTQFWHSHIGMQRGDGLFGSLIVKVPKEKDPHSDLTDFDEHVIMVSDWVHTSGTDAFLQHHHAGGDNKIRNLLINGLGLPPGANSSSVPIATFVVKKGFRYRFRLINAEFLNCPVELSIDNHNLTIIATDGNPIEPIETHSLVSYAGERFDFVLNATKKIDNYWIRFRGLMDCDPRFRSVFQLAILRYEGAPNVTPKPVVSYGYNFTNVKTKQVNPLNKGVESNETINVVQLKSLDSNQDNSVFTRKVDQKFYISYDFYDKDNANFHRKYLYGFHQVLKPEERIYTPQLNHITMKLPAFPLLTQPELIKDTSFCNSSTVSNCKEEFCSCTHVIDVKLNSLVELILIDEGFVYDANHPFHLHGYNFRVIGMERLGPNVTREAVIKLDKEGRLNRNLNQGPVKDTVTVPDGGYTIIRFLATNPGFWLFHCHIEFHSEVGMAMILKVGEKEDFKRAPDDFPRCGDYVPKSSAPTIETHQRDGNEIIHDEKYQSLYDMVKETLTQIIREQRSSGCLSCRSEVLTISVCVVLIIGYFC